MSGAAGPVPKKRYSVQQYSAEKSVSDLLTM